MKKKAAIKALSFLFTFIFALGIFGGCKPKGPPAPDGEPWDYNPYPAIKMNKDKHIVAITQQTMCLKPDYGEQYLAVQALQGLVARSDNGAEIFAMDNPNMATWLADLEANYGFTREYVPTVEDLINRYKGYIKDNGYIKFTWKEDPTHEMTNVAFSLCAVTGYLPVAEIIEHTAINEWGLTKKIDLTEPHPETGEIMTQEWVFDNYKDQFTRDILFHYNPGRLPLRDYAVAVNGFMFYTDIHNEDRSFLKKVYEWAKPNIPVMGWAADEVKFVGFGSEYNKYTISVDFSNNLSTFSAVEMPKPIKQNNYKHERIQPEAGKHYVALCFTDGDNTTWYQTYFLSNSQWFGNEHRGKFAVTWGASVNSALYQPTVLQMIYNAATEKDQFIQGVNGIGYMNISAYPDLETFAKQTAPNLKKADLQYMNLITYDNSFNPKYLEEFGKIDCLKGMLLMVGDKYVQGRGSLYWTNGKPALTFRDTLWDIANKPIIINSLANKINKYPTDYTKIEGYTLLNVHCWNYGMDDLWSFVQKLGDHVEVITGGQLLDMVSEHVAKEDVKLDAQGNRI